MKPKPTWRPEGRSGPAKGVVPGKRSEAACFVRRALARCGPRWPIAAPAPLPARSVRPPLAGAAAGEVSGVRGALLRSALGFATILAATIGVPFALTRPAPPWVAMGAIAAALFFALKLAMLRAHGRGARPGRIAAFLLLWPGMNAAKFLPAAAARPSVPRSEVVFAGAKLALGLVLTLWDVRHAGAGPSWFVAWTGVVGIVLTLHFGLFHLLSCAWRAAGVDAPPIMRWPIAARSLAELWGERWNIAFADGARHLLLRPLARAGGGAAAGAGVFVVSGLVHEAVISLPARGGWGGPMLYFLLQGAGAAGEKSAVGRALRLGLGRRGRCWTLAVATLPLPLLLHAPFAEKVILPLLHFFKEVT